jgi:dephospho-CoA kinase
MGVFNETARSEAMIVGMSGTNGAGKDTGADYLVKNHGFMHVSTGEILKAEADRLGMGKDRPTLINIGIDLRKQYESVGALVIMGIEEWAEQRRDYPGGLVISGMRVVGEAQEVKDQNGILTYVTAPRAIRRHRIVKRNRDAEVNQTYRQFRNQDLTEINGTGDPNRPHLHAVKGIADIVLWNINKQYFLKQFTHALFEASADTCRAL